MKALGVHAIVVLVASLLGLPALAAGDPGAGEKLAQQYCARCHDIAPGGAFKQYPPSFASIAVYRSAEQIYGRIVFPALHFGMPEFSQSFILNDKNISDLVAYITSLEK